MQVDSVSSSAAQGLTSDRMKESLGKDAFLKLLVTQLENQDPLKPMDNTEFISQLAQFSSLEGITNLDKTMGGVSDKITSMENYATADLIGKHVRTPSNNFIYAGEPVNLAFELDGSSAETVLSVKAPNGALVDRIELGGVRGGLREVVWDGTDYYGSPASPGVYTFSLEAADHEGKPVGYSPYTYGKVSGVDFSSGDARLLVNGDSVNMKEIKGIY